MSGAKKSNSKAEKLQEESLAEQRRMNSFQMAFMKRQQAAMEQQQPAAYRAQPPIPTPAKAGAEEARMDLRQRMLRRFGVGNTVVGGRAA